MAMESVPLIAQVTISGPTSASFETPGDQGSTSHGRGLIQITSKTLFMEAGEMAQELQAFAALA